MQRKLMMLTMLLIVSYNAICQSTNIPISQAKEIKKGLLKGKQLKIDNELLLLEVANFKTEITKKDAIIFNTELQISNAKENIKDLYKILELEKQKNKLLKSTSNLKSYLYGTLGGVAGLIGGLVIK